MSQSTININEAAKIFKLLGNDTRLTILKILKDDEYCVCEFVELFRMSQPAISQHMRKLREAKIVNEEKRGQWVFYSINKNNELYPFIGQLLNVLPEQTDKIQKLKESGIRVNC